jgi:hypothetical protein
MYIIMNKQKQTGTKEFYNASSLYGIAFSKAGANNALLQFG